MSKSSSKTTQSANTSQTSTPNNLPYLQTGWNAAGDLLTGTPTLNNALDLSTTGANAAGGAATGGLTTASTIANNGAPNAANGYLVPFANGSMTGAMNPYFANLADQISKQIQASTDGNFAAAGRYGSGANANAFNSAVANEIGQLGYANSQQQQQNQLNAAGQLSTNNANSQNATLAALGLIPGLGTAATGAGQSLFGAGAAPSATYADILSLLGSGGGTQNGTANGTSNTTTSGFDLGKLISPVSLFTGSVF